MADAPAGGRPTPDVLSRKVEALVPVNWAKDDLSKFLSDVQGNQIATFANKPEFLAKLIEIDACFLKVATHIINPKFPVAAFMFLRCHSAFRAAVGMAMSGQMEVFAILRNVLEYAGCGLFVTTDDELSMLWLNRHADEESRKKMNRRFAINVSAAVTAANRHAGERYAKLYEQCIDFGAHPNERGVTTSMTHDEQSDRHIFNAVYLNRDGLQMDHGLVMTMRCGMVALEVFESVFGALYELVGVKARLLGLRKGI